MALIEREALLAAYDAAHKGPPGGARKLIEEAPVVTPKEQEPVKPIYDEEKYGDHLPHCSNCGKYLASYSVCKRANYCSYCGRAVKWDD